MSGNGVTITATQRSAALQKSASFVFFFAGKTSIALAWTAVGEASTIAAVDRQRKNLLSLRWLPYVSMMGHHQHPASLATPTSASAV